MLILCFRDGDTEGKALFAAMEEVNKTSEDAELTMEALTMISTGAVPEKLQPVPVVTAVSLGLGGGFKLECILIIVLVMGLPPIFLRDRTHWLTNIQNVVIILCCNTFLLNHPCKSHDHHHQWADLVMT